MIFRAQPFARRSSAALIICIAALTSLAAPADDTAPAQQTLKGMRYTPPSGWAVPPASGPGTPVFDGVHFTVPQQADIYLSVVPVPAQQKVDLQKYFDNANDAVLKNLANYKTAEQGAVGESKADGRWDTLRQNSILKDKDGNRFYVDVATVWSPSRLATVVFYGYSAEAYAKYAPALTEMLRTADMDPGPPPPLAPVTPPVAPAAPAATPPIVTAAIQVKPPDQSQIVARNADGTLGVAEKTGKPIDGIKLSKYNAEIHSPNIAVAADGAIHVAFVEQHEGNFQTAVYHRSSTDSGKTWSEATNLSDDLPGWMVGNCKMVVDGRDRVYVIWRTGLRENTSTSIEEYCGDQDNNPGNLVYRVLEGGKWSKVLPANSHATVENNATAPRQWSAGIDGAGKAQVVWNASPDALHPELLYHNKFHVAAIYPGLLVQGTLDGANPVQLRPVYMAPVIVNPKDANHGQICDGFGVMTAYFDQAGAPHILAAVQNAEAQRKHPVFQLVEDGKQIPALDEAGQDTEVYQFPPALLVDARGRRHAIAIQKHAEHPHVRDYLLGSNDAPTVIRAAGREIHGIQAFQGPGGRMVVFTQMNDTGTQGETNTYVSMSDGGAWSAPVDITNNSGRNNFRTKDVGLISNATVLNHYAAGAAAGAFDKDGHLLVLMVNTETSLGTFTTGRWIIADNSSSRPTLQFLRF